MLAAIVTILGIAASALTIQFTSELWPGEGIPVLIAGARQLPLRREPNAGSPANKPLAVRVGSRIHFDQSRYQTLRSSWIVVESAATLSGRNLGALRYLSKEQYYADNFPNRSFILQAGTKIEFLQHRAEGSCIVRIDAEVIEVNECPNATDARFRWLGKAEVLWWVRVTNGGKPRGWALVDGRVLSESRREF